MTQEGVFPPAEDDGFEPFRQIAARMGCNEYFVNDAFRGLEVPEWLTPKHLRTVQENTSGLNDTARHARNLLDAMWRLSADERDMLRNAGAVTPQQIEHLHWAIESDEKYLRDWLKMHARPGGKNIAAYAVSEGMRRLFRRMRKSITYGLSPSGDPSTDFCREVRFAIGAFGIVTGWRGPANAAYQKQLQIQGRMVRCALRKIPKMGG